MGLGWSVHKNGGWRGQYERSLTAARAKGTPQRVHAKKVMGHAALRSDLRSQKS
jgi:hypothetical protein